jgi:hypothetical protein
MILEKKPSITVKVHETKHSKKAKIKLVIDNYIKWLTWTSHTDKNYDCDPYGSDQFAHWIIIANISYVKLRFYWKIIFNFYHTTARAVLT